MTDAKTKILNAASALFYEEGIGGLSVRSISKRAGLSTIGIYSHFKGKQGILDALYVEGFEMVIEAMNVLLVDKGAIDKIMLATSNYLDFAEKNEAHYRLIFGENNPNYSPSESVKEIEVSAFLELVKVVALILPDEATIEEKKDLAMQFWALIHGHISLHHHVVSGLVEVNNWKKKVFAGVKLLVKIATVESSMGD